MSGVRFRNVTKAFGSSVVVDRLNLEVEDGEFIVLVGPSGCGKTTTLRMLAGLEEATSGEIFIGERDVTNVHPRDRNVAMVFQSYALYPHKTVAQNLGFALKLAKRPADEIERRVQEVAQILDIQDLLTRKPGQLSGGQRQRVAVGRAIIRNPEVFLFDEPLSNLDAKLRTSTRSELIKLHQRLGATMVYVTHDQVEAMTMGDRIVVMDRGLVQQIGTPLEIYDDPVNTFVAAFIGSPSMNLFPAALEAGANTVRARFGHVALTLPQGLLAEDAGEIFIGIRPEFLSLPADPGTQRLSGMVETVEHLGAETLVEVAFDKVQMMAKVGRREGLRPGETVEVGVPGDKILAFNTADGRRLAGTAK